MTIVERGRVDWSQQYSRKGSRRQHVQIAVHALTLKFRSALLTRSDAVRHRLSSYWRSLTRQVQKYLEYILTSLIKTGGTITYPRTTELQLQELATTFEAFVPKDSFS
jgi:hypothetical protein